MRDLRSERRGRWLRPTGAAVSCSAQPGPLWWPRVTTPEPPRGRRTPQLVYRLWAVGPAPSPSEGEPGRLREIEIWVVGCLQNRFPGDPPVKLELDHVVLHQVLAQHFVEDLISKTSPIPDKTVRSSVPLRMPDRRWWSSRPAGPGSCTACGWERLCPARPIRQVHAWS